MAFLANEWGEGSEGKRGYRSVGAVVGATFPRQAERLRELMPNCIFLVPGYGAQGGTARDVVPCFNSDGYGAIVNSSRGVIFAYQKRGGEYDEAARNAALDMKKDLCDALMGKGIYPW